MNTKVKRMISVGLALVFGVSMVSMSALYSAALNRNETNGEEEQLHRKIPVNEITNDGGNPGEISGAASAAASEKKWYEYIPYSPQPVASARIDDDRRLLFYDPYNYSDAMVMEIDGEESEWSSANTLTVSYTTGKSVSDTLGSSTNTGTSVQVQSGKDEKYSHTNGTSTSTTKNWSDTSGSSDSTSDSNTSSYKFSAAFNTSIKVKIPLPVPVPDTGTEVSFGGSVGSSTGDSDTHTTTHVSNSSHTDGGSDLTGSSDSETTGWSTVADRITTSTGITNSTSKSWTISDSKTVTRTFHAAYFNENGAPLQWKVVQYSVYMPMKFELQSRIDGDWISTDSSYCLLRTIQGTSRAYLKNTQTYVEDWGTGEPVVWNDFWNRFFTEDSLMEAYNQKLYPEN